MDNQLKIIKSAKDCNIRSLDSELNKGIDINQEGNNLLLYSVIFGDGFDKKLYIDFLLRNNININQKSPTGRTALHFASMFGDYDTLKLLVDNGIDINALNYREYNALMEACEGIPLFAPMKLQHERELIELNISMAEYLFLESYYNNRYYYRSLRKKLSDNQIKIVEYLLKNGINKDNISVDNNTALDLAIENNHLRDIKIVELLSKFGVLMNNKHDTSFNLRDELFDGGILNFLDDFNSRKLRLKKLETIKKYSK